MHQRRMKATGLGRVLTSAAALALAGVLALMVVACQPALELSSVIEREVAASAEDSVQPPPAAPSDLAATAISPSEIDLTWVDNSDNEDEFEIQRDSGSGFQGITSVGADSTAFSDSGLDPETEYTYRVRSSNGSGNSEWSAAFSATTLPLDVLAPESPSGLQATVASSSQINLTWEDDSDTEDEFEISRKQGSAGQWQTIDSVLQDSESYQDTGLDPVTEYIYRVRATNSSGASEWTGEVSATTDAPPLQAPTAPSGLTATTQNADQIDLGWSDNSGNEAEFEIQRKEGNGGTYAELATLSAGTTGYQDTGLDSQTTYYYRVRATNSEGASNWSIEANATTAQLAAPSGLTATGVNSTRIELTWDDNSSFESGFEIELDDTVITVSANTQSYNDTGLSPETQYTYRVRAVDPGGTSSWSNTDSATTDYEIGDTGPAGGLIFFDDEDNGTDDYSFRYLEAAPASTEWTDKVWGGYGTDINGDNATVAPELEGIGAGASNTVAIRSLGTTEPYEGKYYAARYAGILSHNGYTDWFLPSEDELKLMRENLHQQGLGGFAADAYWSSTETNGYGAWPVGFSSSGGNASKYVTKRVRAARAFGN